MLEQVRVMWDPEAEAESIRRQTSFHREKLARQLGRSEGQLAEHERLRRQLYLRASW